MIKYIMVALAIASIAIGCTPEEGKGGKSTITGKIFVEDYNKEGELKDEYYPGEYPVYIIYGEETIFGDDEKTHADGSFVFEYLYAGNYTIFVYSKCKTCPGEREIISQEVTIERGEVKDIGTIVVID